MNNSIHDNTTASSLRYARTVIRSNRQPLTWHRIKRKGVVSLAPVLISLVFALQTMAGAQDFQIATSPGGLIIRGYTGAGGDVIIPSTINGLPVTGIEMGAFDGLTSLTRVSIPHSVTNIGRGPNIRDYEGNPGEGRAFSYCTSLEAIDVDPLNPVYSSLDGVLLDKSQTRLIQYPGGRTGPYIIPESVTKVDHSVFVGCTELTSVSMGDNVVDVGQAAFKGCSALANITLGNGLARIGIDAFNECTSLTNILIPQSVTNIGYGLWVLVEGFVFTRCTSLNAIVVDPNNPAYSSVEGVLFDKSQTELLQYPGGRKGSYTMPHSVTSVGYSAFSACTNLTGVTMGASVTNIGWYAFSNCNGLNSVTIPDAVTEIWGYAFSDCPGLTNVTIGNNVGTVEEFAFYNCTALATVTFGSGITNILYDAFYVCPSLTAVYFRGNAPSMNSIGFLSQLIVYYLPGTTGWGTEFAGRPTALWLPRLQPDGIQPTAQTDAFGFTVSWARGQTVMVETCSNLSSPTWTRLPLTILTNDSVRFHDPGWTNDPARFYRVVGVQVPADVIPVTNMVFIPPGTFTMGSPVTEAGRWDDEGPQTPVTISRGFWMGRYEVTQGEYLSLMATNPSHFNGVRNGTNYGIDLSRPVERVRWSNAVAYCEALTASEQAAGRLPSGYAYRLPTEAEWEYACRAGTTTPFFLGNALHSGMANFNGRLEYPPCGDSLNSCTNALGIYLERTVSVGGYAPNPWGLHDMLGNVSEWCQDWFGDYSGVPVVDPQGAATGNRRCSRGSSWIHPAVSLRSALRDYGGMEYRGNFTGFRVVLAPIP